jgi:hypothetical protein
LLPASNIVNIIFHYCFGNNSTRHQPYPVLWKVSRSRGEQGLLVGDRLVSVDGHKANTVGEFATYMASATGEKQLTWFIKRNGELIKLDNFPLKLREYTDETGAKVTKYGLYFETVKFSLCGPMQQSRVQDIIFVRIVWISLGSLFNGKAV